MSMDADFGTISRPARARGSNSNRKRKHVPGQAPASQLAFRLSESELLLTAIEKIAFSGQRTLQFDDHPFEVGAREPNLSTRYSGVGIILRVPQALLRIGQRGSCPGFGSSIEPDGPSS
jgi:hypothetical protein